MLGIRGKSTQIKIETVIVTGPSIFEIKLSNIVVFTINKRNSRLSNFYVVEPKDKGLPQTIGSFAQDPWKINSYKNKDG